MFDYAWGIIDHVVSESNQHIRRIPCKSNRHQGWSGAFYHPESTKSFGVARRYIVEPHRGIIPSHVIPMQHLHYCTSIAHPGSLHHSALVWSSFTLADPAFP